MPPRDAARLLAALACSLLIAQQRPAAAPSIETTVQAAYHREFGERIEHPALYDAPTATDCQGRRHTTTTAYLRTDGAATLLTIYLADDGTVLQKSRSPVALLPAGRIRVLSVIVRYPETISTEALSLWDDAQKQINQDHAAFAQKRGYATPIVVFESRNLLLDADEIGDPHNPSSVRAAVERHGVASSDYRILMTIDINPRESAGGLAIPDEHWIYVGNYSRWRTPLGATQWGYIARTAYHHEMAHHWGWPGTHDWAPYCGRDEPDYAPFIAPPVLFGWEDLEGHGVPEILSDTPYGRRP